MIRIAVDMDEVITDTFPALLAWYQQAYNYTFSHDDCVGKPITELVSAEHAQKMEELLTDGRFFASLPVMPGAQSALRALSERFEIFITTAAMEYPNSCEHKFRWLREHFAFIEPSNIVFCGDKSIIHADFLIDDNIRHFQRFCGKGILFTSPSNALLKWQNRVDNWQEALDYFR
ncbi:MULTISPECIES: 5'-3'-deoxyribonucleotidase [unclassified Brenneria]|uniref:5' nucleotidase, NT5C type n=1 Tax=unclassified Brenneria TaxID=2634434 RepID=UPI0029C3CCEF|nr:MULTISPECIES: 5'-3'-deoxyribonucleotidase [unclassified Brenneria]MDX5631025.1 5'-3'-deoxyribonucleotidase [Brenneria sp. L3-3Z]MDX5698106.1 5'-3'-deoxyribonucleotidase [Brenneria sp. L4-2C]MEE3663615.1 5'-3'-deoxyribonucleotidase [Brenneria sp. g21c3]